MNPETDVRIPSGLLPRDGRFGSGPSKVRAEQVAHLAAHATDVLGTSHRQEPVRSVVRRVRASMRELFALPDGWEVTLGNGGATAFWDAAAFGLIEARSAHLVFGEFSRKFAECSRSAPHLRDPHVVESEPGSLPEASPVDADAWCLTHNETSTGVAMDLTGARDGLDEHSLVLVDATSAAGAMQWSPTDVDVYYFSPQKAFGSDGGTWFALMSPTAVARIESIRTTGRWCPAFLDLGLALDASRRDQTLNTPSIATLLLVEAQLAWMRECGGLTAVADRSAIGSTLVYEWAERSSFARPFVTDPALRSPVVCTVDLDGPDADSVSSVLRRHGIVDVDGYRGLGRNQLRIATFPAVDTDDISALLACIDHVVDRL